MIYLLLFLIGVLADQLLKHLAVGFQPAIPVIPGFFELTYVTNRGAAWGFLQDRSWGIWLLLGISLISALLLAVLVIRANHPAYRYPLLLMLTGCVGNLIDRFLYQGVVDFLHFQFGTYSYPVFNLADIFLVLGVIGLMIALLRNRPLKRQAQFISGHIDAREEGSHS